MDANKGKQERIVDALRLQITEGHWAPGERLPSNKVLQDQYGTTAVTIGRVTRRLMDDGYLYSRERSGVFVSQTPPHTHRFGIAFHTSPGGLNWSRMEDVICSQALHGVPGLDCEFVPYYGIEPGTGHPDFARLQEDLAAQRLGGLFFATDPWLLYGKGIMENTVPKAAVMMPKDDSRLLAFNFANFADRAIDWLAAQGCRRVAVINSTRMLSQANVLKQLAAMFAEHDLPLNPSALQFAHTEYPQSAAHIVRLFLELPADRRPDGLLIGDDNLTEQVETVLLECGVSVPNDLQVVSHCNFPATNRLRLPFQRIGYDTRDMLLQVVDSLRATRRGQDVAAFRRMPAIFEHEYEERWHPHAPRVDRAGPHRHSLKPIS